MDSTMATAMLLVELAPKLLPDDPISVSSLGSGMENFPYFLHNHLFLRRIAIANSPVAWSSTGARGRRSYIVSLRPLSWFFPCLQCIPPPPTHTHTHFPPLLFAPCQSFTHALSPPALLSCSLLNKQTSARKRQSWTRARPWPPWYAN